MSIKTTLGAPRMFIHGANRFGDPTAAKVDTATHSLIVITYEHHEVHAGSSFRYTDSVTLASAAVQDYLLTVPNTDKWPHFTFSVDGTAITTIDVYRATDKTGSTLQSTFNANENSATVAGMTIHKGTSGGTTDGTKIFTFSSGTSSGSSKMDGISAYASERILKQNTKYIIRITSGTNDNKCNMRAEWYEHTSLTT